MFSRSTNTATDRLRCARSTTSMQAAASRQRSSATSDPIVTRHHAEVAATQAYRSIQPTEPPTYSDYRPAPPMLHRKRSQVTGRSEGSHLEDARLGRRRSTAKRDENKSTPSSRRDTRLNGHSAAARESGNYNNHVSTLQPSADRRAVQSKRLTSAPNEYSQKPPPSFRSSSPLASGTSVTSGRHVSQLATTPRCTEKSYDDGISITYKEPQPYADRTKVESDLQRRRASIRETQTDEEIVALARGRRLQDFQHHKIRERKSFFGSFQNLQRRNVTDRPPGGITYDSSLPPFNYADSSLIAPLPPAHDMAPQLTAPDRMTRLEGKTRIFSGSVKGQFKKLLRKATWIPSEAPLRQAEAKIHEDRDVSSNLPTSSVLHDPFVVQDPQAPLGHNTEALFLTGSLGSNLSVSGDSAADKSRVTSWTNSTSGGTMSTTANTASTSNADEHGRLKRSSSHSTLRKKGSFFGRTVQNRLRKSSRAELRESDDSQALFAALRERIMPKEAAQEARERAESASSHVSQASGLSSLPSQQRAESRISARNVIASTIRTVSPDLDDFKMQTMSPVVEASPERVIPGNASADHTPTANHYKSRQRPAPIQAAPPSPERIARRVKQSQTRWQGTLNTTSTSDQQFASAYDENIPYELPNLARKPLHAFNADTDGLPQHAKISQPIDSNREKLLSPSIYSRATNDMSPRPSTPDDEGMIVTITSREVKRYEISPSKKDSAANQRPVQASNEWRNWLSAEMDSLTEPDPVGNLVLPHGTHPAIATKQAESSRERAGSGSHGQRSDTPASDQASRSRRDSRPRASSRRSSYMNERYPMVDSTDNPSRQSHRANRKFSTTSTGGGTDTERSSQHPTSDDRKRSIEQTRTRTRTRSRAASLPKRHSLAHLDVSSHYQNSNTNSNTLTMSGALQAQEPPASTETTMATTTTTTPRHKHRSAFDLRAKYKSSNTSTSRPLEVRRKTTTPTIATTTPSTSATAAATATAPIAILEDNTIRNISAGPYALSTVTATAAAGGAGMADTNKENTPPPPPFPQQEQHADEEAGLPALSSSEWLAGPGVVGKKRAEGSGVKGGEFVAPAAVNSGRGGREGSPGQRLVTGWLEGRRRGGTARGGEEGAFV